MSSSSPSDFPFDGTAEQLHAWLTSKYGQQTAGKFSRWTQDELLGASETSLIKKTDDDTGMRIYGALQTAKTKRVSVQSNTAGNQRRPSPIFLKEVYILGIISGPSEAPILDLLGTTFAVSDRKLLTAAHVIYEDDGTTLLPGQLVIAKRVEKRGSENMMVDPIRVKRLDDGLPSSDFAILELVESENSFTAFIPLCAAEYLPDVSLESVELKCYYAPIGQFMANAFEEMYIWAGDYERVLQYDKKGTTVLVNGGLYRGSCGAPYVNHKGWVVALHVSSMHEGRNVSLVKKRKRGEPTLPATSADTPKHSELDDVIDTITNISEVHGSIREGLVLCKSDVINKI